MRRVETATRSPKRLPPCTMDGILPEACPMRHPILACAALLLAALPARAGTDLSNVRLGSVVHGPEISLEDLAGQVVLVDFWGTH